MSFRRRLFLAIFISLLISTTLESIHDYYRLRQNLTRGIERAFNDLQRFAEAAISFGNNGPELPGLMQNVPEGTRFRVMYSDEPILTVDNTLDTADLALQYHSLPNDYSLELAVDTAPFYDEMQRLIREDLLDDTFQIIVAIIISLALARYLLRPISNLTAALDKVSRQEFPGPVPVPPGADELSQLAESFNRMSAGIQAAFERERVFTRYASHELRTPLSAMKAQLEALELGLSPAETVLPKAQRHAERMQRILDALLSLARAAAREHEPVTVVRLVDETLQLIPADKRVRILVQSQVAPDTRLKQPYLVGQCLLNLVENALKYTDKSVTVRLREADLQFELCVEDEGGGVSEEIIAKLTHTFFRLSSQVEGTGLGLAFVRHIAQTLKGDLLLANTKQGLAVTLRLPVLVFSETADIVAI